MTTSAFKMKVLACVYIVARLLSSAEAQQYGEGVRELSAPIVIARQRPNVAVPPSYLAGQPSRPGGYLRGADQFGTVVRFAPTVRGALIRTEDYGSGKVGGHWNDNNTQGDKTLRANLCSSASDFTVDGRAEIGAYPWGLPGVHGIDHPNRADGLCVEGAGFRGNRLRFFQIPGTALRVKGGKGGQAGAFGIYDEGYHQFDDIKINHAINGIVSESGDTKFSRLDITGIVKDGLTLADPGATVNGDHINGADRACVITQPADLHHVYHEAARIGTEITGSAHGTTIDGLNVGPGTCWERCVIINAHGCTLKNVHGGVKGKAGIVGVEIRPWTKNTYLEGQVGLYGEGCSLDFAGNNQTVYWRTGWNQPNDKSIGVRVTGAPTGANVTIIGNGDGGTVLDLSASTLDQVDGLGDTFKITWTGTAARVVYPGGGNVYNLAAGTTLVIDGKLQSTPAR